MSRILTPAQCPESARMTAPADPPGSWLQTLEDDFVPAVPTDCSIEISFPQTDWQWLATRVLTLTQTLRLSPPVLGWGAFPLPARMPKLVVTFANRAEAALFKLFWLDNASDCNGPDCNGSDCNGPDSGEPEPG